MPGCQILKKDLAAGYIHEKVYLVKNRDYSFCSELNKLLYSISNFVKKLMKFSFKIDINIYIRVDGIQTKNKKHSAKNRHSVKFLRPIRIVARCHTAENSASWYNTPAQSAGQQCAYPAWGRPGVRWGGRYM